jgi:hypothetical protein
VVVKEAEIQSSICDYLALRRHFFSRINNIPAFNRNGDGSITMRRLPKHTLLGMADIIVVHVGRPYFLEVKRPGTYQSPAQKAFQAGAVEERAETRVRPCVLISERARCLRRAPSPRGSAQKAHSCAATRLTIARKRRSGKAKTVASKRGRARVFTWQRESVR